MRHHEKHGGIRLVCVKQVVALVMHPNEAVNCTTSTPKNVLSLDWHISDDWKKAF